MQKYSRRHGQMFLASYPPGDGSIDFNWVLEADRNGAVVDEPVTESDVSEWMRIPENEEQFKGWEVIELGRNTGRRYWPRVRLVEVVERIGGGHNRLRYKAARVLSASEFEYTYHGPVSEDGIDGFDFENTTFYAINGNKKLKVLTGVLVMALVFFLNHEKDFELNGFQTRVT